MSAPSAQPPLPLPPRALVAVLRAPTAERFVSASKVLWDAGITCFEYTLTSEGALDALVEARQILPDAAVGVGTVRTTEHLKAAAEAGAAFAVSQVFLPELVAAATGIPDPLRTGHSDTNRGALRMEHRRPRGQGVPDRLARRGHLSQRAARTDARRLDHAHRRSDAGSSRRVSRRGRGCRRSQRRVAGGRPARRRSRSAESAGPATRLVRVGFLTSCASCSLPTSSRAHCPPWK